MRKTAQDLKNGGVERHGEHVTITYEHCAYIIKRSPWHKAGHAIRSINSLWGARVLATVLKREEVESTHA